MRILIIGILFLLFQSCAFHYGSLESTISNSNQSYKYVDVAAGYSKVTYFMGLGGLGKDMLASEAMRNMRMSVPLKSNQTIENVVLNYKTTLIGPFFKMEAMAVADVVEWKEVCNVEFSDNYTGLVSKNKIISFNNFNIYDEIVVLDGQDIRGGRIVSLSKNNGMIFYIDNNGRYKFEKLNIDDIYWNDDRKSEIHGFTVGDVIVYSVRTDNDTFDHANGIIISLNNNFAIINSNGKYSIMNTSKFNLKKDD